MRSTRERRLSDAGRGVYSARAFYRERRMGLNIKNEDVIANVRKLAEIKGTSLTAAIDEAVAREIERIDAERERDLARRRKEIDALLADIRSRIRPLREGEVGSDTSDFYDDWGMPK